MGHLLDHGGRRQVDGHDLGVGMGQRGARRSPVVEDHVDAAAQPAAACSAGPVRQDGQDLDGLLVVEAGEGAVVVGGEHHDLVDAAAGRPSTMG